jgi:MoaA/NifB/PqqE/SkfB family radical SAM enzyme
MGVNMKNRLNETGSKVHVNVEPQLRVVEFQLLQDCNINCSYCAYDQEHSRTKDKLPLSLIERTLLDDLSHKPPEWVWFEGGEVTMDHFSRSFLLEALAVARKAGVKSRINTNGQKCSPEYSSELASVGLSFACVSCDSVDPPLFCRMRGMKTQNSKDLFEEFAKNVRGLVDAGITINLEVTLTRFNIGELEAVYDFAESLGSKNVIMGVQFLVATSDHIFDLYPDFASQHRAISSLIKRAEKGSVPIRICCCPLTPCRYPDLYEPREKVIWIGCSCGYDYVHVHATGEIFLCGFWDHAEPIGSLHNASLTEIWQDSLLRRDSQTIVPPGCSGCSYWEGSHRCHNTCFSVPYRKTRTFNLDAYTYTGEILSRR